MDNPTKEQFEAAIARLRNERLELVHQTAKNPTEQFFIDAELDAVEGKIRRYTKRMNELYGSVETVAIKSEWDRVSEWLAERNFPLVKETYCPSIGSDMIPGSPWLDADEAFDSSKVYDACFGADHIEFLYGDRLCVWYVEG